MKQDYKDLMQNYLSGISDDKKSQLDKLASSDAGKELNEMLGGDIKQALDSGDSQQFASLIRKIMSTKQGSEMAKQIDALFGGKEK